MVRVLATMDERTLNEKDVNKTMTFREIRLRKKK